jgi:hypothetical protein
MGTEGRQKEAGNILRHLSNDPHSLCFSEWLGLVLEALPCCSRQAAYIIRTDLGITISMVRFIPSTGLPMYANHTFELSSNFKMT